MASSLKRVNLTSNDHDTEKAKPRWQVSCLCLVFSLDLFFYGCCQFFLKRFLKVGTRLAQGSAQGWHKVEVGQVANSPFRVVGVVSVVLPSDVEICVVCFRQITQSVILLAKGREIVDFVAVAISRSMILHARASKIIFFFSWRYLKS